MTADYDVELHNIVELDRDAGYPGPLIRRCPRAIAEHFVNGTLVTEDACLSEIRFVVESGRRLAVCVTSLGAGEMFIYRGDLLQNHVRLPAGAVYRQVLDFETDPFASLDATAFKGSHFSQKVWRVVLDGPTLFHGIDLMGCAIRKPMASEKPRLRWLAYGSSITHGYTPVSRQQCYVAQTARRLGVDVINFGLSGSCFCETVCADYLASREDWDFITCELGINMRRTVTPVDFESRARYLVEVLTTRQPGKPVVLISPFTTGVDFATVPDADTRNVRAYELALRKIVSELNSKTLHLINGREILPDVRGLTCDLVHPSTEGHTVMAENLSAKLQTIIQPLP